MFRLALILAAALAVAAVSLLRPVRTKDWLSAAVAGSILVFAVTLAVLLVRGVEVPSPIVWIEAFSRWFLSLF